MKAELLSGCRVLWNIITYTQYKPMVKELKKETIPCVARCHHEQQYAGNVLSIHISVFTLHLAISNFLHP